MNLFKHVAIVGKYNAVGSRGAIERVAQVLHDHHCEVALETDTARNTGLMHYNVLNLTQIGQSCDLAVVLGGDGTMLGVGRHLARYKVPVIGINQGRLGFITDVRLEDVETLLPPMLAGRYTQDKRQLMYGQVWRDGHVVFKAHAMNDVVVNRSGSPSMIELRVEVDGQHVANQRADGLIISSPTGSTAYALSAGGSLLHPTVAGWLMVPIAPHTLSNRPLVLPDNVEVSVEIVSGKEVNANFDMQNYASLIEGDRIVVKRSDHALHMLHPEGWSYYATLRQKLHWNEGGI